MNAPYLHNGKIEVVKPLDSAEIVYHRAIGKQKQIKGFTRKRKEN